MAAQAVNVAVRIKPGTGMPAVFPSEEGCVIQNKDATLTTLDGFTCIVGGSDQHNAYAAVAEPLVDRLLEGYSCTLMAYGQTGSGKTHTIFGPPGALTEVSLGDGSDGCTGASSAPAAWGLFPRIALELLASGKGTLHASAVEVYQERAYDLLADRQQLSVGAQKTGRQVAGTKPDKDPNAAVPHKSTCSCRSCYLAKEEEKKARAEGKTKPRAKAAPQSFAELSKGVKRVPLGAGTNVSNGTVSKQVESFVTVGEKRVLIVEPADVARLARTIEHTRTAEGHLLNARSSRSHCLVHLHLTERDGEACTKRQFLVVDLAGSERILRSGAEGVQAAQAMAINTSLTALGKVVRAVGTKASHVPYRDSTLTQLLRSSLSGASCTSVVIAVAAESSHGDESKCSLEFGQRLQAVRTKAAIVVGDMTATDEEEATRRQLLVAKKQLAEFEASGYSERFGPAAQAGEKRAFKESTSRVTEYEKEILLTRAELSELNGDTSRSTAEKREQAKELNAALREMSAEVKNLKGMIKRQKLISGFYIPARAVYTRKLAEVQGLENRLESLREVASLGVRPDTRQPKRQYVPAVEPPVEVAAPTLAEGWSAHLNDENGMTYYYNKVTGTSTYKPPPGFSSSAARSPVQLS
jgi:hypothetical protein